MKVHTIVIFVVLIVFSCNFAVAQKNISKIGKIEYLEGSLLRHQIQLELEDYSIITEGYYPKNQEEINVFKTLFVKKYPYIRNEITKAVGIDYSVAFLLVDVLKTDTFQISKPTTPGITLVGLEKTGAKYRIDKTDNIGFVDNSWEREQRLLTDTTKVKDKNEIIIK